MKLFKKLFKIAWEEHKGIDEFTEDPIKLTEKGIEGLRNDLRISVEGLAQVKAMAIRARNEVAELENKSRDLEEKAILLLKKSKDGSLEPESADRLAKEALSKRAQIENLLAIEKESFDNYDDSVTQLEHNVSNLRIQISKWENELKTLIAREQVKVATNNLNKHLVQIDSSNTVDLLERMKDKVAQEEALSDAYGDLGIVNTSIEAEIDEALDLKGTKATEALQELKEKLGMS